MEEHEPPRATRTTRVPQDNPHVSDAVDIYENVIHVGDKVNILTRERFDSKEGKVTKISKNRERVTSKDLLKRRISRAPYNLRVVNSND